MSESPGPVRAFWSASLTICAACVLLWLAVQLIESIWVWLLAAAAIVIVVAALLAWRRRRSDRW